VNVLVLKPGRLNVEYAHFVAQRQEPVRRGMLENFRSADDRGAQLAGLRRDLAGFEPGVVAVRGVFGGEAFRADAKADSAALAELDRLSGQAPLHGPLLAMLARECVAVFPEAAVVLMFETAFFADLPHRERVYALEAGAAQRTGSRRYGFHGLLHEAACAHAGEALRNRATGGLRALSICLEPRPEVAAVAGGRPVMVTGGATPLDGIPGHGNCGHIDPSLALTLSERTRWGPEQVNRVLTERSGLSGLAGEPVTLGDLFQRQGASVELAREVFCYRVLLACGAGMAALGGVDAMVFSGRYAEVGRALAPRLRERLTFPKGQDGTAIDAVYFAASVERVMADRAAAFAAAQR